MKKWRFERHKWQVFICTPWLVFNVGRDCARDMLFSAFIGIQPRWALYDHGFVPYAISVAFSAGFPEVGFLPYSQKVRGVHQRWVFPYFASFHAEPWPVEIAH